MQALYWEECQQWKAREARAAEGDFGVAIEHPLGPQVACWDTQSVPSTQHGASPMEEVDTRGPT